MIKQEEEVAKNIIALIMVAVLGAIMAAYGDGVEHRWSFTAVAYGLLKAGVCATLYGLGKVYCIRWYELRGGGSIHMFLESLFVPAMAVLIPLGFLRWVSSGVFWIAAIGAIFLLRDGNNVVRSLIQEKDPRDDVDGMFYLRYPPRESIDMLPLDIIYFLFIGVGVILFGGN